MAPAPLTHLDQHVVDTTIGPMQLGNFFNSILLGVLLLQVGQYYLNFRDPMWIQCLVGLVLIIDVVQSGQMMYMTWQYAVANYANLTYLASSNWALSSIPFYSVPVSWIVQGFYAWRIYVLTKRWYFTAVIVLFAAIQGAFGIYCGIDSFFISSTADNVRLQKFAIVWFIFAMLCDLTIVAVMFWSLSQAKTGFRNTDTLIHKIIRTVIETGLATSITVLFDCLLLFEVPGTDYHLLAVMAVGKVYSNSFMYLLNSRGNYRKVTSVRTADFAATLDRSNQPNSAQVHTGPRGLSGLKFAPNEANQTRGGITTIDTTSQGVYVSRDTYVMTNLNSVSDETRKGNPDEYTIDPNADDDRSHHTDIKSTLPEFD